MNGKSIFVLIRKVLSEDVLKYADMELLDNIPVEFKLNEVLKRLRLDENRAENQGIKDLIEKAKSLINPRALYVASTVSNRREDSVYIDDLRFTSRILAGNLTKVDQVFPFILTIGKALEAEASSYKNVLHQFYLESLGDLALRASRTYLENHITKKYSLGNVTKMSPGELEDWPITQQKQLFSLFGRENHVGVELKKNFLMMPRKSTSGILFPTETNFVSCQLCVVKSCLGRRASYDERLKKKYGLTQ